MKSRAAFLACVIVTVAACSVTVVPAPQTPAPQPAPVVVQQAPPNAPPVQQGPPQPLPAPMPGAPTRVGRLALVLGTVSFRPDETEEWSPAEANWPVASGDRVWTDMDARAEVDFGVAMLRVGPQSALDVVQLDDRTVQVRLPQGALMERVFTVENAEHEIDAPNAAVTLDRPGAYRVDVSPDGLTTTVTVWGGEATVSEAGSSFVVNARQSATVSGPGDAPTFRLADAAPADAFDRWSMERDAVRDGVAAGPEYVPAGIPGAADLGPYGRWEVDPTLGPVWYPTSVSAGWAPYRTGRWAFVRPWGWTWVDTAPWGYAPYHYGRWAYRNGAWGWCPGRVTNAPPVYAPALVQFVNAPGPNAPTVAWVPLGPVGYRNENSPSAVTVMQRQAFANQERVEEHLVVTRGKVTGIMTGAPAVQPVRIVPASRAMVPPAGIMTRAVVAVHAPTVERHDLVIIHPTARAAAPARTEPTLVSAQGPKPAPTTAPAMPIVKTAAMEPQPAMTQAPKPAVASAPAAPTAPIARATATEPPPATIQAPKPAVASPPTVQVTPPIKPAAMEPAVKEPAVKEPAAKEPAAAEPPPAMPVRLTPMQNGRVWKAGQVSPALEADYDRKKTELDERQRAEKEHPKEGESATDRDARHEQEKRDLDAAFEKAKSAGATSIPRESETPH